ncbi:MAG: PQQ-binding-like beta-propeller repeat protein [Planctomycetales bacterium]|nr:PQQ-binding-like beta-propeller repeat protein [Planctomycetales bacterium]
MEEALEAAESTGPEANPVRLLPAVIIVLLLWAAVLIPPRVLTFGMSMIIAFAAGLGGMLLAYLCWWLFFSRVPWLDRLMVLFLLIGGSVAGVFGLFHPTAQQPGLALVFYILPGIVTLVTVGLLLSKRLPWRVARWVTVCFLLLGIGVWGSIRIEGCDGELHNQFAWRWTPTEEQKFLANLAGGAAENAAEVDAHEVQIQSGDWPNFRGPDQDSRVPGVAFSTNWDQQPPRELWRRLVGPAWSSFAVVGGRLYTQEQRGEEESVVCYDADTGDEIWANGLEQRFYRVEAGYGPLATPTFQEGAIYTTGPSGSVQRMNAATGQRAWVRELKEDLPRHTDQDWGFASSPLVVTADERTLVIVFAGNPRPTGADDDMHNASTIAYDAQSGEPVWTAGVGHHGYATPLLAQLGGRRQVLVASNRGLESLEPFTGHRLWFYEWDMVDFPRTAMPLVVDQETVVLLSGYGYGSHGVRIRESDKWVATTLWETRRLKPYFNDCVYHQGHVYGFDDKYLTCIDTATGESTWSKRTRRDTKFGCGQVLLIADAGLLLVTTETSGEVVLLEANPDRPVVLARFKALDGKTWNHPVVAHGRLYLRNGAEAVCYELPPEG